MSLTPTKKQKVRSNQTSYCRALIANEPNVHYTQARRFHYYDNPSARDIELDCSGTVGNVYWNAMHDTGIYLADPLNFRYTGIGNTSSMEAWLRVYGKWIDPDKMPLLVGDIVRWGYGEHAHTAVVYQKGTRKTARLCSHGREAGPLAVALDYRTDLVGVWRHPALV